MANTVLTQTTIAKIAVRILENELVAAGLVHRAYEDEFAGMVNGLKKGDTISIRKPAQFTVRDGAVASSQDVVEGKTSMTVDKQKGVDFEFTSKDLTLSVSQIADRVIKPAMIQLANQVDSDVLALTKNVPNWVGTPGTAIASFAAMARAAERFDLTGVPQDGRNAILSPTDAWAMAGSQTALYMQNMAQKAYREGAIGEIAGFNTHRSVNLRSHTFGPRGGTPLVNGAAQVSTYASVKDTAAVGGVGSLITDGWTAAAASRVKQGDVFTIANVYAVNPVTKATQAYLQQFVVNADVSSDGSGNATLSITPAIITSGAFQTVSAAPADNAALTFVGTASAVVAQNVAFHKNAFGLVVVPMEKPEGAVRCARESYKGLNVRLIPFYDGTNDVSKWRLDILYGVKTLDERLACLIGG
jgi:ribosomal 50S subunit-recycling heat shock protein